METIICPFCSREIDPGLCNATVTFSGVDNITYSYSCKLQKGHEEAHSDGNFSWWHPQDALKLRREYEELLKDMRGLLRFP